MRGIEKRRIVSGGAFVEGLIKEAEAKIGYQLPVSEKYFSTSISFSEDAEVRDSGDRSPEFQKIWII